MQYATIIAPIAALLAAGAAFASVDTSPKPDGVYRLKPGIYVAKGESCRSPANAVIRQYDGRGISGAHSRACRRRSSRSAATASWSTSPASTPEPAPPPARPNGKR